jgi:hypothetical protein
MRVTGKHTQERRTSMISKRRINTVTALVIVLTSIACGNLPLPVGKQSGQLMLSDAPEAELVFIASDPVWTLSSDDDGNLYILTDNGDILRIDADGDSESVYSGLALCGFSRRVMTVLPDGDLVVNDCVDKTDILMRIDQNGNATVLQELSDNLLSLSSDPDGNVYVGTWTSEGDITLNLNPTHLGGADDIMGQVSKLSPDGTLDTIYEGGIPVALAVNEEGDIVIAIWGKSGPFRPEKKDYSVCSYLGLFWVGMSDQVEILRIADGQDQTITETMNAVSTITSQGENHVVVGMHDSDSCGLYLVGAEREPQRLTFSDDEIDDNIRGLTIAGGRLHFVDVDGNVYRVQ